jgi:phosphoenolpyruvate synthase/pyruvate phosphate dikinase
MIPLNHPKLRPEVTADQIKKYSQKKVDVINLKKGGLETIDFRTLVSKINHPDLFYAVSVQKDGHLAAPMFKTQDFKEGELCVTFDNQLTKTDFVSIIRKVLSKVEKAYNRPIDMEFAWDEDKLYLLQCRPLSTRKEMEHVAIPKEIPKERILFRAEGGLSNSILRDLEYIVYVDPKAYDNIPNFDEKMKIGRVVNLLNKHLE